MSCAGALSYHDTGGVELVVVEAVGQPVGSPSPMPVICEFNTTGRCDMAGGCCREGDKRFHGDGPIHCVGSKQYDWRFTKTGGCAIKDGFSLAGALKFH